MENSASGTAILIAVAAGLWLLYLVPMFWRGDWGNLAKALTWGLPAAYCFVKYPLG